MAYDLKIRIKKGNGISVPFLCAPPAFRPAGTLSLLFLAASKLQGYRTPEPQVTFYPPYLLINRNLNLLRQLYLSVFQPIEFYNVVYLAAHIPIIIIFLGDFPQ